MTDDRQEEGGDSDQTRIEKKRPKGALGKSESRVRERKCREGRSGSFSKACITRSERALRCPGEKREKTECKKKVDWIEGDGLIHTARIIVRVERVTGESSKERGIV